MEIEETPLQGCVIVRPNVFHDDRGFFYESFNQKKFEELTGATGNFVQDNLSKSKYGVLRGLHLQRGEAAQAKLVSCLQGKIYDVAVDLRKKSPTFKKWFGVELSEENKLQLYLPRGFAHGFVVLSDDVLFSYKCDNFYDRTAEASISFDDPELNIDWKLPKNEIILSEKDRNAQNLSEFNFK